MNQTRLGPNLDPGGPTQPEIGFKLSSFRFIKYIVGLNPNLNPIWGQPDLIGPVFWPWGPTPPDPTQPEFGSKIGFNPKKRVGFGQTSSLLNPAKFSFSFEGTWTDLLRQLRSLHVCRILFPLFFSLQGEASLLATEVDCWTLGC